MAKKLPNGWTEGTVQEFLDLTDEEMQAIEDRLDLEAAHKAMAEEGSVSWEKVKAKLDL